jgi:hypothetical protein
MFKIDYFIFKYFLTSKIAVLYKKMSNVSPLLNRILFFPKNKLLSVMSNCSTNCEKNSEEKSKPLELYKLAGKKQIKKLFVSLRRVSLATICK